MAEPSDKVPDFAEAMSWSEGVADDYDGSVHAALIDYCFCPGESYDDAWAEKLWDVYLYIEGQPCLCTEPAVDQYDACPRCRLLNREFDQYVGHGR